MRWDPLDPLAAECPDLAGCVEQIPVTQVDDPRTAIAIVGTQVFKCLRTHAAPCNWLVISPSRAARRTNRSLQAAFELPLLSIERDRRNRAGPQAARDSGESSDVRFATSARTTGATSVPNSSIERITSLCATAPTLI